MKLPDFTQHKGLNALKEQMGIEGPQNIAESVFGIDEHIPRYGLWITTDPRSRAAVASLVAEGYDFKVTYKWGCRAREIRLASQYLKDVAPGGRIHEAERLFNLHMGGVCRCLGAGKNGQGCQGGGDYIRDVFVSDPMGFVRYVDGIASRVPVSVIPGDVIETVAGVRVFDAGRVGK